MLFILMIAGTLVVCGGIMVGTFLGIRQFIRIASRALVKNVLITIQDELQERDKARRLKK